VIREAGAFRHWVVWDRVDGVGFVFDPLRRRAIHRVDGMRARSYMTIVAGAEPPWRAGSA
jgi:hypothetical protein